MDWQEGTTIAQRLRVRGSGLDALTTRLRLTSLLEAVDLRPPGLPPSAVVCIRRLRDPLPGALSLQRIGQRPPHAWQHALRHALAQSVQQAVRPVEGPVPANAGAVVFNDRAELLACLAHDWCEGAIDMHWWWQSLLKGEFDRSVLAAWLAAPEYAPAALQHLAQRGTVLPFAEKLSTGEARQLLESITRSFALYELQPLLSSISGTSDEGVEARREEQSRESGKHAGAPSPTRRDEGERRREDADTYARNESASHVPPAPWSRWIPESAAIGLSLQRQSLLGVGLMLWRAPMQLRSAAFLRSMRRWLAEISVVGRDNEILNVDISQRNDYADNYASDLQEEPRPGDDEGFQQVVPREESESHREYPTLPDAPSSSMQLDGDAVGDGEMGMEGDAAAVLARFNRLLTEKEGEQQVTAPSEAPEMPTPELHEAEVDTAYGGLFYLLNLALALNLYSDFTSPLLPGIPLSIWDFLALVGERLLGEALRSDAIWGLLARLAGRDVYEAPGQDFVPVTEWRVSLTWLAAFPEEDAWEWCVAPTSTDRQQEGRLCVFHPAGFAVLDVPLIGADALQQLLQAMQPYGDAQVVQRSREECSAPGASSPLTRWLDWLVPYLCARLHRALGLAEGSAMVRTLCEHRAHIVATATHLDMFLSLNDLPIEIRLAGLDRDPAWIPAAGRFVAFHFL